MSKVTSIPQLRFPEFSGEWKEKKLSDVAEIVGGGTPPTAVEKYWGGDIQWFTPTEIKNKYIVNSKRTITQVGLDTSSARLLPKGTLLFSSRATVGEIGIAVQECTTNQGFQSFIVNKDNDSEFLYNWIIKNKKEFIRRASGSTFLEIGKSEIKKIKSNIPLLSEQQKIAAFLTAVDNKIEQLSKKQALLGEYKKGLMQQIFSQAIRFHSKGTSSQAQGEIDDTPGQPLLPNGNSPSGSDFPDWEEKKLGDITDLITKGTTPTSVGYNFTTEGINFIKVESIKNFKIDIGSVPKISEECHHHLKRSQLKNNDIVFSIAGTLGRTAIVKNKDLPANTNQALSIIRLNRSQHILFVHYLLNLESIDKYIHRMLSVGAQPNLSLQQVGDIQLQLPSLLEQSKITNFLSFIDSKIEQVGKQLDESKQFKKALLQQMFI